MKAVVKPTSTFIVNFDGTRKKPQRQPNERIPRATKLLVLAHLIDAVIRSGEYRNLAEAARALNLTRARVTQITNLLLLAPEIQQAILDLPPATRGRDSITERQLRPIAAEPGWDAQLAMWRAIHSDSP